MPAPCLINLTEGCQREIIPLQRVVLLIGREGSHVQIQDMAISPNHASIINVDGRYYLRDNGSINGSFVNGERIQYQELKNQDIIRFGYYRFQVLLEGEPVLPPELAAAPASDTAGGSTVFPPRHRTGRYGRSYQIKPDQKNVAETLLIFSAEELKRQKPSLRSDG